MTRPQPSGGFEWTQAPWGAVLTCAPLAAAAHHLFTAGELTLRNKPEEWAGVAAAMGVAADDLLLVKQVHAAHVAVASRNRPRPWPYPEADAIISDDATAAVGVRVADCVPVLLAEDTGRAVAAVHAGWRGIAARTVIAAVSALWANYGVRPERLIAAIGPSIGPCCYEVGESTRNAFIDAGHHGSLLDRWFERRPAAKFHLNLWAATRDQLEAAGLPASRVFSADLCTRTHASLFHSYRAHGSSVGRMVGAIKANR